MKWRLSGREPKERVYFYWIPFDEYIMSIETLIDQITSPNLQDDDYGLLLDLVELVNKTPTTNVIEAVRFLKVKLQSSNANTLLRAITLLDFLAQNCGAMLKASISTPDFVNDNLLPIIADNLIHISVKYALIKEIYKLQKTFANDESLSIYKDTFSNLKRKLPNLCQQAIDEIDSNNKNSYNPSGGSVEEEELELRKAIELSLKESSLPSRASTQPQGVPQQIQPQQQFQQQFQLGQQLQQQPQFQPQFQSQSQPQVQQQPITSPQQQFQQAAPTRIQEDPSRPDKVIALFDLSTDDEDTLSFRKDDIITIVEEINKDWLRGCLNGRAGIIPTNYVKPIPKTLESDIQNLIQVLNSSFDIETTLSKLMDLNKKVKNSSMTSQQFENALLSNSFPDKIQNIEKVKAQLKQILELQKLKLLELQSIQSNIDHSLQLYQQLITESAPEPENPDISNFIQTYPDISSLSLNSSPQSTEEYIPPSMTGSYPQRR